MSAREQASRLGAEQELERVPGGWGVCGSEPVRGGQTISPSLDAPAVLVADLGGMSHDVSAGGQRVEESDEVAEVTGGFPPVGEGRGRLDGEGAEQIGHPDGSGTTVVELDIQTLRAGESLLDTGKLDCGQAGGRQSGGRCLGR